jgi:hypothetical protein
MAKPNAAGRAQQSPQPFGFPPAKAGPVVGPKKAAAKKPAAKKGKASRGK